MVSPLGVLLGNSWSFFRRAFMAILVGAVLFGLILGVTQSLIGQRAVRQTESALEDIGINMQQMQDIQQRIQAGDQAAIEEFFGAMPEFDTAEEAESMANSMASAYRNLLPAIGVSMLIIWLISLIASAYFLLIALNENVTPQDALVRVPGLIIPLFLLSLWIFVRTFMWIPFIGIITGIILGPRFILSPVLLVRDRKGVIESAKLSYAKTSGFWGKILGNVIVAAILALVAQMVAGFILGLLGMRLAGILLPVVQMLASAFLLIFMVKLALTVEQNPQKG